MRESLFSSTIRAFLVALFSMLGICVGLILLMIAVGALADTNSTAPEATFSQKILPNAKGDRKTVAKTDPVILQMNIDGTIGSSELNMNTIRNQLIESREGDLKDNRVKGILLRINSPGGTVVDADGIYKALKAYKEQYKVPVYAYVDGLCASGGMYVAAAADKIYASDVSLIGSIGVISPSFMNFTDLIDKIGVKALTLSAGKDKDMLNPLRPWKPGESEIIQNLIDYYYAHFVNVITTNMPKVDKTKLINDYGAKVFNPNQAVEYGFITATNFTHEDTLKELLKELNITDDKYQVVELEHKTWWNELFKSDFSLLKGTVTHRIEFSDLDANLQNKFLYLYRP